jgi:nucleoside diphosphate kinase
VHLTPEQVAEIYAQHYGCPSFPNMVVSVSLGPLLVLSLAGLNAVEKWKSMVGPYKTLQSEWFLPLNVRNRFGFHVDIPDALHASENVKDANRENRYFYPQSTNDCIEHFCNPKIFKFIFWVSCSKFCSQVFWNPSLANCTRWKIIVICTSIPHC